MRPERRGHRAAAEQEYRRPRSFAEVVQQEPDLRALSEQAKLAAKRRRRGNVWRRIEVWATWTVVALTVLLLAAILLSATRS